MPEMKHKKLLIITVEEILLLAVYDGVKGQFVEDYTYGSGLTKAKIFLRPCLREFLDQCLSSYRVGLWSEYSPELVQDALQRLYGDEWNDNKLEFLLTSDDCVPPSDNRFALESGMAMRRRCKSLDVIVEKGYPVEDIIIVDDDPKKWEPHGQIPRECWVYGDRMYKGFGNVLIAGEMFDRADRSLMEVWKELSSVQ